MEAAINSDSTIADKIYERYRDELYEEDKLIKDRITWLLTSQTILFTAYGFLKTESQILYLIVPLGFIISWLIYIGVLAALLACFYCRNRLKKIGLEPKEHYPRYHRKKIPIMLHTYII